jgi:signal transduction histidine kinase
MDPATLERAMVSIERNAQSQARVVEDLIELSRVVTGKLQLRTQPLDLALGRSLSRVFARQPGRCDLKSNLVGLLSCLRDRDRLQVVEPVVQCRQVHRIGRFGRWR